MKKILTALTILSVAAAAAPAAAEIDPAAAFERLKAMEGTWKGTPEGQGEEAEAEAEGITEVVHEFEISAAGTVLMETMMPGTDHEMINMYFLDGDDLVLTHYCAGGNQPRMRLDRDGSTTDNLIFDHDGGTNLENADHFIHSANLRLREDGGMDSQWYAYAGGEPAGGMTFRLARADGE